MAKANLHNFDYQKVAQLDCAMWLSYSRGDKRFILLFPQALALIKKQLGFSWLAILKLAYYAGWAALAYRLKKGRENYIQAEKSLIKMFKTVSDNCTQPFDYKKAAELELEWWDIQRYPAKHTKNLEQSLNQNMATVYSTKPSSLKGYGVNRAEAINLVGSNNTSREQVLELFTIAWQALHQGVSH